MCTAKGESELFADAPVANRHHLAISDMPTGIHGALTIDLIGRGGLWARRMMAVASGPEEVADARRVTGSDL